MVDLLHAEWRATIIVLLLQSSGFVHHFPEGAPPVLAVVLAGSFCFRRLPVVYTTASSEERTFFFCDELRMLLLDVTDLRQAYFRCSEVRFDVQGREKVLHVDVVHDDAGVVAMQQADGRALWHGATAPRVARGVGVEGELLDLFAGGTTAVRSLDEGHQRSLQAREARAQPAAPRCGHVFFPMRAKIINGSVGGLAKNFRLKRRQYLSP